MNSRSADVEVSTRSPQQVAQVLIQQAVAKHASGVPIQFGKAFVAGVFLSFGGLLSQVLSGGSPGLNSSNPGLLHVLAGFVFPVGLTMIVLQGQELLTSNMMTFPMAAIKRVVPWWATPLNWLVVFFGNLCGSLFTAAILVKYSGVVSSAAYVKFITAAAITKAKTPEWHQIFLRGIGCNWLVCIAIWQAAGASDTVSKIFALWLPIWTFVAVGFDHVVANMFSIPLGIMLGADLTVAQYIRKSLIAAFLGNVVGAQFVALPFLWFYWPYLKTVFPREGGSLESDVEEGNASGNRHDIRHDGLDSSSNGSPRSYPEEKRIQ